MKRARVNYKEIWDEMPDCVKPAPDGDEEAREARERANHVKLLILIAAGVARPTELAATRAPTSLQQYIRETKNVAAGARKAAFENPRLCKLTGRFIAHNPLGARRAALSLIEDEREKYNSLTVAMRFWGHVLGID